MIEVKKKPRETTASIIRRFTQKVRESGILVNAKKSMFYGKIPSRIIRRKGAIEREVKRKERMRLKKIGKL